MRAGPYLFFVTASGELHVSLMLFGGFHSVELSTILISDLNVSDAGIFS